MEKLLITSKITAVLSFSIGTCLTSFYIYLNQPYNMEYIGIAFILFALLFNSILLLVILINMFLNPNYRLKLLKACGIILLNLPIAWLYLYLIISIKFPTKG